jgi:hypothetical protein
MHYITAMTHTQGLGGHQPCIIRDLKIKSKYNLKPCGIGALNVIYSLRARFKFLYMEGLKPLKFIKHNIENPTCRHAANHSREFPVNVQARPANAVNATVILVAVQHCYQLTWSCLGHSFSEISLLPQAYSHHCHSDLFLPFWDRNLFMLHTLLPKTNAAILCYVHHKLCLDVACWTVKGKGSYHIRLLGICCHM